MSGNKIQTYNKERKENYDKKTSAVNDVFLGIKEIKGFNLSKNINSKVNNETNKYVQSNKKYTVIYYAINIVAVYIFEILRLAVFIYGVYEIAKWRMEIGILLLIEIEFNHVLYGYRHDPMLSDFSVKVKPKSITAITGKTGSGKTGIFDLLMKMNRQLQGSIMIDGIDISSINDTDYYNLVSIARKIPFFFKCSIKENKIIIGKN